MRRFLALVGVACLLLSGCGEEEAARDSEPTTTVPTFGELPFGVEVPEGAELLAEPVVWEGEMYSYAGQPVRGTQVQAVLRVTGEDPLDVFEAWVHELGRLGLGPLDLAAGRDAPPGSEYGVCRQTHPAAQWCEASFPSTDLGDRMDDHATVQLWVTDREPIILVGLTRFDDGSSPGDVTGEFERTDPPSERVEWSERGVGDLLFEEQGAEIVLPEGTRSTVPMLPVDGGTGGSYSILTTTDPLGTLEDLRDQAIASTQNGFYESEPVAASTTGDAEIWELRFNIPAGGWGFTATAIRPAGSTEATIYVSSYAD